MSKAGNLKRRSFVIDEQAPKRAKRLLRVASDGEAIRVSLERVAEMERFWRFMEGSRAKLAAGSVERP